MNPSAEEFRPPSSSAPPPGPPHQVRSVEGWNICGQALPYQPPPQPHQMQFPGSAIGGVGDALPVQHMQQRRTAPRPIAPNAKEKNKVKGKKVPIRPSQEGQKNNVKWEPFPPAPLPVCALRPDANSFFPSSFSRSPAHFPSDTVSLSVNSSGSSQMGMSVPLIVYKDPSVSHLPPQHRPPSPIYNNSAPLNSLSPLPSAGLQPLPPRPIAANTYLLSSSTVEGDHGDRLSFPEPSVLPINHFSHQQSQQMNQQSSYPSSHRAGWDVPVPVSANSSSSTLSLISPSTAPVNSYVKEGEAIPLLGSSSKESSLIPSMEDPTVGLCSVDESPGNSDVSPSQQTSSPYVPPHLQPGSGGTGVSGGAMYVPPSAVPSASLFPGKQHLNSLTVVPSNTSGNKSATVNNPLGTSHVSSKPSASDTPLSVNSGVASADENDSEAANAFSIENETDVTSPNGENDGDSSVLALQSAPPPEPKEEDLPGATPVSFAGSRLPKLFQCPETNTVAPNTPIKLSTAWELYADDHQTLLPELLSSMSHANSRPPPAMTHSRADGTSSSGDRHFGDFAQLVFDPVPIALVNNLEEFWRLWRYATPPSACSAPFTYSWFRENITPDWEHPRNRKGGTMSLYIFDRDRMGLNDRQNFDDVFLAVLLACVGESFVESASTVNGVMLKLRQSKPATLQIWTAHGDFNKLKVFVKSLREILGPIIGEKHLQKIEFFLHPRNQVPQNSLAARLPKPSGPDHIL